MNLAKSQLKIAMTEDFGRQLEGMADGANKKMYLQQGAKEGLEHAAKKVVELGAHVDKDVKEGVLDEFVQEPLKIADYVKRYLNRAAGVLDNLATTAEIARISAGGREAGLREANKLINDAWQEERKKLQALHLALQEGSIQVEDESGAPSGHPGLPLKAQRQVEDGKGIEGTSEEPQPPAEEEASESEPGKGKKGKKRSSKKAKKKK